MSTSTAPHLPASEEGSPAAGISARGLARRFGDVQALAPFDLDVAPGTVTGLLGPNGSGKSTFMRCLVGLVRPDAGTATIAGVTLEGDGVAVRRRATYAPGELHLYGELRGRDQLTFLLRGRGREAVRRAHGIAEDLGLPLRARVRGYSHGMKRQLLFAAALAPDVPVRILDEISEGLDPAKRSEVLERIDDDARGGRTVLLSSHHLGEVDRACERLLFVSGGRLIADESSRDVRRRAARLVSVTWPDAATAAAAADALRRTSQESGVSDIHVEGARTAIVLDRDDPRPFLARIAASDGLAPLSIEHGRVSLAGLYRDLYGVEGT